MIMFFNSTIGLTFLITQFYHGKAGLLGGLFLTITLGLLTAYPMIKLSELTDKILNFI